MVRFSSDVHLMKLHQIFQYMVKITAEDRRSYNAGYLMTIKTTMKQINHVIEDLEVEYERDYLESTWEAEQQEKSS